MGIKYIPALWSLVPSTIKGSIYLKLTLSFLDHSFAGYSGFKGSLVVPAKFKSNLNGGNLNLLRYPKRKEFKMANTWAHCRYCGSDKVDTYRALNGIIVYECDACWRIWNNSQLPKIQEGINPEEV